MRKQEPIHLHGLLVVVSQHCERAGYDIDHSQYESLTADASAIHHRKDEHREAVFALAEAIATELKDEQIAVSSVTN
jgi:hypothetical protein